MRDRSRLRSRRMEAAVLGIDTRTGEKVELGYDERNLGLYVIGAMGTGKSTLLLNLITQDMEAGFGVCVLDPPGSLVEGVLERVPAKREGDVVLLDPLDTRNPFGLNLFECQDPGDPELVARSSSQVMHVFEKLWGPTSPTPSWGPQMADLIRNSALTLIENPGMTMAEMPLLLESAEFRARLVERVSNLQVRSFWENTYDRLGAKDQIEYRLSTLNKVREFLTQPVVLRIVGQSKSTVNFRQAMDEGKIVLIPLSVGRLGEDVASLLGSVVIGQVLNAALSREELPEEHRRPFHLYADEYQRFATPDFATLLAEARKFKVATTIAHQFRDQFTLRDPNRGATLNVANKVVFRVSGRDADELASEFDTTPPPPAVIGQKPVLSICQHPADELLRSGHRDQKVKKAVSGFLAVLRAFEEPSADRWEKGLGSGYRVQWLNPNVALFKDFGFYVSSVQSLKAGFDAIDSYLVAMMEKGIAPSSDREMGHLGKVLSSLRAWIMIGKEFELTSFGQAFFTTPEAFAVLGANEPVLSPVGMTAELAEAVAYYIIYCAGATKEDTRYRLERVLRNEAETLVEPRAEACRTSLQRKEAVDHRVETQMGRLDAAVTLLMDIGRALSAEPLLTNTSLWEPIYDKPRTYQDMQNETATMLANLPNREARCKIVVEHRMVEHPFRTLPPRRVDASSVPSLERIRAGSRMLYTLPAAAVDEEIRKRQQYQVGSVKRVIPLT